MIKYILKRILYLIPVMLLVTLIVFFLMSITKGDPARIVVGESASLEEVEAMRESMGLNDPFFIRYLRYVRDLFLHGNMGTSYKSGLPVMKEITSALPSTIRLSLAAITIAILIGIPIGIISATKQYSFFDNFTMILGLIGISMPVFWLGLLLMYYLGVLLHLLPVVGELSPRGMIMPIITICFHQICTYVRQIRTALLEEMSQDYVRGLRSRGIPRRNIILKNVLPNSMLPLITLLGLSMGSLLGGTAIVEVIFTYPGMGNLAVNAITGLDYPVVQAYVLWVALIYMVINLIVDISYNFIDPRMRVKR